MFKEPARASIIEVIRVGKLFHRYVDDDDKKAIRGLLRSKMGLLRKMYKKNFIRINRIQDDDVNHGG